MVKGKSNRKRKVSSHDADIAISVLADELTAQQRGGSVKQVLLSVSHNASSLGHLRSWRAVDLQRRPVCGPVTGAQSPLHSGNSRACAHHVHMFRHHS
jgi:hypothetical protein